MKKYIIGNMKMNFSKEELVPYLDKLRSIAEKTENFVGVALPSIYINLAEKHLQGSRVQYGGQNIYPKDSGTFTGEISAKMLKDYGCSFVLVAHSERRSLFIEKESDANQRIKKALEYGLTPILCYGETLEEKQSNKTFEVLKTQLEGALVGLSSEDVDKIIFAYEPVWAIGKGNVKPGEKAPVIISANKEVAEEMISYSKQTIINIFPKTKPIILYGGSMNSNNVLELLSQPSIDGGLIGTACLKIEEFEKLITTEV